MLQDARFTIFWVIRGKLRAREEHKKYPRLELKWQKIRNRAAVGNANSERK